MTIDNKIWDEELQYNIHGEATNIFIFSLGKIDKCDDLTGKEMLPVMLIKIKWFK